MCSTGMYHAVQTSTLPKTAMLPRVNSLEHHESGASAKNSSRTHKPYNRSVVRPQSWPRVVHTYICTAYLLALEEERRSAEAERGSLPDLEAQALGADGVLGHDDDLIVTLGQLDRLLLAAIIMVGVYTLASLE